MRKSKINAECNNDNSVSLEFLQDEKEIQFKLESGGHADITDNREQDEQSVTNVNISINDSVKVCDNYSTFKPYTDHCPVPDIYI